MIEYGGPASAYKYGMPTKLTVRMQDLLRYDGTGYLGGNDQDICVSVLFP